MNLDNIPEFKIRASAIGKIMGGLKSSTLTKNQEEEMGRLIKKSSLTPKQEIELSKLIEKKNSKPELSQGAKTYCKEWLKEQLLGRRNEIDTKYTIKGNLVEKEAIYFLNQEYEKNTKFFPSNYITGEPDIVLDDKVIDIKCPWDWYTHPIFEDKIPEQDYYYQLQGYMILTGRAKADLTYVLIETPEHLDDRCKKAGNGHSMKLVLTICLV